MDNGWMVVYLFWDEDLMNDRTRRDFEILAGLVSRVSNVGASRSHSRAFVRLSWVEVPKPKTCHHSVLFLVWCFCASSYLVLLLLVWCFSVDFCGLSRVGRTLCSHVGAW